MIVMHLHGHAFSAKIVILVMPPEERCDGGRLSIALLATFFILVMIIIVWKDRFPCDTHHQVNELRPVSKTPSMPQVLQRLMNSSKT